MRLGLSSDAAPGARIEDLIDLCARRGLGAVELNLATIDADTVIDYAASTTDEAVRLSGLFTDALADPHELAVLSRVAGAPVVVRAADLQTSLTVARTIEQRGGTALALVAGPAAAWLGVVTAAAARVAWQVDATCLDPAGDAAAILQHGRIDYVRLVGGGPETAMQEGRGVGALMRRLALAAYDGPLILTPSSDRYRLAWSTWLGRRGGWGCGSTPDRAGPDMLPIHA